MRFPDGHLKLFGPTILTGKHPAHGKIALGCLSARVINGQAIRAWEA
jgi:hypothetical protein